MFLVDYIEDLLEIDAVRWLNDVVQSPKVSFYSNSIIAQCAAAVAGAGIVMLPTFVAAGVDGLVRVIPEQGLDPPRVYPGVRASSKAP